MVKQHKNRLVCQTLIVLHTLAPLLESVGTSSELAETMEGACAKI